MRGARCTERGERMRDEEMYKRLMTIVYSICQSSAKTEAPWHNHIQSQVCEHIKTGNKSLSPEHFLFTKKSFNHMFGMHIGPEAKILLTNIGWKQFLIEKVHPKICLNYRIVRNLQSCFHFPNWSDRATGPHPVETPENQGSVSFPPGFPIYFTILQGETRLACLLFL